MNRIAPRTFFTLPALAIVAILLAGFYLQFAEHLSPCPLCMMQRLIYVLLGLICLVAIIHNPGPKATKKYALGAGLIALAGISLALRQVYLQHLPADQVPSCGGDFFLIFKVLPFTTALKQAFMGSADCAEVQWAFLGLSIPAWSALWFGGFVAWFGVGSKIIFPRRGGCPIRGG